MGAKGSKAGHTDLAFSYQNCYFTSLTQRKAKILNESGSSCVVIVNNDPNKAFVSVSLGKDGGSLSSQSIAQTKVESLFVLPNNAQASIRTARSFVTVLKHNDAGYELLFMNLKLHSRQYITIRKTCESQFMVDNPFSLTTVPNVRAKLLDMMVPVEASNRGNDTVTEEDDTNEEIKFQVDGDAADTTAGGDAGQGDGDAADTTAGGDAGQGDGDAADTTAGGDAGQGDGDAADTTAGGDAGQGDCDAADTTAGGDAGQGDGDAADTTAGGDAGQGNGDAAGPAVGGGAGRTNKPKSAVSTHKKNKLKLVVESFNNSHKGSTRRKNLVEDIRKIWCGLGLYLSSDDADKLISYEAAKAKEHYVGMIANLK